MTRGISKKICSILLGVLAALACFHSPTLAADSGDQQTLDMFYEGEDLVVTTTRNPKPISQTAENITVITAAEIEMMGAHTLPEVLNNVPGLQTDNEQSVGALSNISIQGAPPDHILVLLDGVTFNFYSSSFSDLGVIPVQNIERIEIVKGAGSSSWGSALGGVINIITKSPDEERKLGGALSFSAGERGTWDSRGETSGTLGPLGYYLYAGNLASGGFRPNTRIDENNLYTKLRWELPQKGRLLFTLAYNQGARQGGEAASYDISFQAPYHYFLSTLALSHPLGDHIDLDLSLRGSTKGFNSITSTLSIGDLLQNAGTRESIYGGSVKLSWRAGIQGGTVGADFDHIHADSDLMVPIQGVPDHLSFRSDKLGLFLIDTLTFGDFAITPGIRYDRMNQVGDSLSPSLGLAWSLNDRTTLRAYGGHGYSLPFMLPGQVQEKVLTFQAGVETSQVPWLWLKTTLFRNELSDVQTLNSSDGTITLEKQLKQGVELEVKSVPLFNAALSAGYTFVDATNRETGETLQNIPRQIVKLGLHYDDNRSLRGTLLGRYVWWNASLDSHARDNAFIWDLNLAKRVLTVHDLALELFFNAHNLFNGAQYSDEIYKNARRWLEGGIRCAF